MISQKGLIIDYCVEVFCFTCRYNCNRYDEEEARRALDAQEVIIVYFIVKLIG